MFRRVSIAVLACVWMWASSTARVDADCATQALVPRVLTPTTVAIPRDGGGIVVGMRPASQAASAEMPAAVQLTRGRRTQELVARVLAPGLVRFAAVSRLTAGQWTAAALGPNAALTVGRRDPLPGVPTRPVVTELRRVAATGMSARRAPRTEVRATLEFPVPAGIVAIVTYWGDEGAAASAWEPVIQGQRDVVIWQETPECEVDPAGRTGPPEGAAMGRIAYVDQFGQVSPPSAPVAIR